MRLTKAKTIEISIELWTWLAGDGRRVKHGWHKWKTYGVMVANCPLCEYAARHQGCRSCPFEQKFAHCQSEGSEYVMWRNAALDAKARQRHASAFLEQLRQL